MSDFRCGRVAVVGRTNAGKSTLLNRLVGEKVAITSSVPQTTRHALIGVHGAEGLQVVFVDTPGVHLPQHALNRRMLDQTWGALDGVDLVVVVVDASDRFGKGDRFALERVQASGLPFLIALNKVDLVKPKERLLPEIERLHAEFGAEAVVPLSAKSGRGVEGLVEELRRRLPVAPPQFPTDIASDQSERFFVAELIREKVLDATRQEVPHATAVLIDAMEQRTDKKGRPLLVVQASLVVEKPNQKGILIGKGGSMLKRVGTAARLDVEQQLGTACHLELFVRVAQRWRDDERVLAEVFAEHRVPVQAPDAGEPAGPAPDSAQTEDGE